MKKIGFIINPISGTKPKDCVPEFINKYLEGNGNSITIKFTVRAGHATELAAEMVAQGFDVVAAVGGDGTVNEVAKALIHTNTAFAIIPFGSGNGLARHLGIPLKTEEAIKLLADYKVAEIDYATANGIPFFCTCGAGFDAHIGHQFAIAENRGFFTYLTSTIREFIQYKPKKYKIYL